MQKFYFTFGQSHAHAVGGKTFDKDCVCVIEAETEDDARAVMFDTFGPKWAFCYTSEPDMSFFPRGFIYL